MTSAVHDSAKRTTAFVAGATGYTGRSVVPALVARGVRTIAHVRPDSTKLDVWRERFAAAGAEVDTTPWDADAMAETFRRREVSHVLCLIGTTARRGRAMRAHGGPVEDYMSVDFGLTDLLVRAALASGRRPRFLYLSAAGASGRATSPYGKARWLAEEAVRRSGLDHVIARPSFITGDRDEDRAGERIGARIADGALAVAGALGARRLRDRYQSMTGAELAAGLVRVLLDPNAHGEIECEGLRP